MLEVKIPKEITEKATIIFGPYTGRQILWIVINAPFVFFLCTTLKDFGPDLVALGALLPGINAWFWGWFKYDGLRPEALLGSIFYNVLLAPQNRKDRATNEFQEAFDRALEEEIVPVNKKGKPVKKKEKYKKSKLAFR